MPCASSRSSAVACSAWSSASVSRAGSVLLLVLQGAACQLERDDRVDQPLLRAVVQIANHAPALLVGRRHDPRPRRRELRPRFGVRDRRGDQLRELGEPILDVVAQGLGFRDTGTHHAPELAVDDDRRAGA